MTLHCMNWCIFRMQLPVLTEYIMFTYMVIELQSNLVTLSAVIVVDWIYFHRIVAYGQV